jgi:glycosyltransferase involved in cell wall biosynthesis
MKTNVSVIICVKDAEKYIGECVSSLLDQTFKDFEIVIIDDGCNDNTAHIIQKSSDERIRYFRNEKNLGIAKSRNTGLKLLRGEYIFFTDADCVVSKNWIKHGLKSLEDQKYVGVEGKIYYVSEEYKPTFSDHVCKNEHGGHFMTGNMAYKRSIVESVGGFDEKYDYHEDRDLALRILKHGKICFNPNMIVYVQQQTLTPKDVLRSAGKIKNRVYLYKRFGERKMMMFWRIVNPFNLAKALFPPLVFVSLFFNTFKTSDDFKLLPFTYVYAILERLQLWKTCARERVFLI